MPGTSSLPSVSDFFYAAAAEYPDTPQLGDSNLQPLLDSSGQPVQAATDLLGFHAEAFIDSSTNAIIVAFEGTMPSLTLFGAGTLADDVEIFSGNRPLLLIAAAEAFMAQVQASAGGRQIFVTGHSLGGFEAEAVAHDLGDAIAGGATFGAPGLPGYFGVSSNSNVNSFLDYVDLGDPVGNYALLTSQHYGSVDYLGSILGFPTAAISALGSLISAHPSVGAAVGDLLTYHNLPGYASDLGLSFTSINVSGSGTGPQLQVSISNASVTIAYVSNTDSNGFTSYSRIGGPSLSIGLGWDGVDVTATAPVIVPVVTTSVAGSYSWSDLLSWNAPYIALTGSVDILNIVGAVQDPTLESVGDTVNALLSAGPTARAASVDLSGLFGLDHLPISVTASVALAFDVEIASGVTMNMNQSDVELNGLIIDAGGSLVAPQTWFSIATDMENDGQLQVSPSSAQDKVAGNFRNNGQATIGGSLVVQGATYNSATLTVTNGGAFAVDSVLFNSGTIDDLGGFTTASSVFNAGGNVKIEAGADFRINDNVFDGTLSVIGGGEIDVQGGGTITGAAVEAISGGTVSMQGGALEGVTLSGGGTFEGVGGGYGIGYAGALEGVTLSQGVTYTATQSCVTALVGSIDNYGVLAAASGGFLAFEGLMTLAGGGAVMLSGGVINAQTQFNNVPSLTSAPDHLVNVDNTIAGAGGIYDTVTNQSGGVIDANVSGLSLRVDGMVVNAGLMEATNGGTLSTYETLDNTGGTIEAADGSKVAVLSDVISGGVIEAVGTGTVVLQDGDALKGVTLSGGGTFEGVGGGYGVGYAGALEGVTLSQGVAYTATQSSVTALVGSIDNYGVLAVVSGGFLAFEGLMTLGGGGVVMLSGGVISSQTQFNNVPSLTSGPDHLVNVDNRIEGAGGIYDTVTNQSGGVIDANVSGLSLRVDGMVVNAGLMKATNGGTLSVYETLDNAGGTIEASGTGVVAVLSASISGGALVASGGTVETKGGTVDSVTVNNGGDLIVDAVSPLTVTGSSTLSGTVAGGGALVLSGGTTTFGGEAQLTIANLSVVGNGTVASIDGDLSYAGDLSVGSGATIAIAGNHILSLRNAVVGTGDFLITDGGALIAGNAFNQNVAFSGAGSLSLLQTYAGVISGFSAADTIDLIGLTSDYAPMLSGGVDPALFTLVIAGNVVTQTNADGSKLTSHFNIAGQSYTTVVRSFDKSGDLIAVEHAGITGAPYIADTTLYSGPGITGNIVSGNELFYANQASGLAEVDLDGSGNLTRALYAYVTTAPGTQSSFEADYVAGELAGGTATYLALAGASYSTFNVEYDNSYQYVGAVYNFNYTGQTYDAAQYSYTAAAQPKLTEATFSQYTGSGGPNVASFFYDNNGASTGVQYSYTGIAGQAYTSDTLLYNAANVLIAAEYGGYTTKPFSSQTTFFNASGAAQEIVRDFTSVASAGSINGQAYNAYEKILNPAFTLLATAYHLDNGGNVYVGVASNVTTPSFGGTGVSANAAELSNTLTGGDWTITGGGTGETFNFVAFFNQAEITDYGAAFNTAADAISVSTQDFADWTTMLADAAASGGGANTTFTSTTTGDKLTLDGVTVGQLTALTANQAAAHFTFHA